MKKKSKLITVILTLAMLVGMTSGAFAATGADDAAANEAVWDVSKSKTATNLDENFESQVTLSLPAAEEQLVSDVVFVLDKSTSGNLEEKALGMLEDLQSQVKNTNAKVKVAVVIFNREAHITTTDFKDLATQYDQIEDAIKTNIQSGTNSHAGLLAGKQLLDDDTSVAAARKYMIFVSDGVSYIFNDNEGNITSIATKQYADKVDNPPQIYDNATCADLKWGLGKNFLEDSVADYLSSVGIMMAKDNQKYWGPYGGDKTYYLKKNVNLSEDEFAALDGDDVNEHANNIDTALYKTWETFSGCVENGYHCYAIIDYENKKIETTYSNYPWGEDFMEYLAEISGNQGVSFDKIKNEINYLISKDSYVIDEIGNTDDYNFDFIDDASKLKLTVGEENLDVTKIDDSEDADSAYGFGKTNDGFRFVLKYYRNGLDYQDDKYSECFKWEINAPVKITEPVQLTYSVKLTNPKTEAGTYGTYDADGSKKYDGLYTNNSAVLYPVDTNKQPGASEAFNKPTVSYTVAAADPAPVTPNKTPGGDGPQTSDDFNMLAVCAAALAALLAGTAAVTVRRKRQ